MSGLLRRLLTQSSVYLVSNVAMRAMTLVLAPIYTRAISPEDYGALAWANTVGALVTLLASLGLAAAIARFIPGADAEMRAGAVGSAIVASVVASGGCVLAAELWSFPYARLVLWASALSFAQGLAVQYFAAREKARIAAGLNLFAVAVSLAACLYFVVVRGRGLEGALLGGLVAAAVTSALSLLLLLGDAGFAPSRAFLGSSLAFSLPIVPHLVSNWALSISDRMFIERLAGKAALAPYAVAYFFNLALVMGTSSLGQALTPIFVREADAARTHELPRLGDAIVGAAIVAGVFLCVVAPWVVPLIAPGPEYAAAVSYVPWLVLGALFQGVYFVLSQGSWYSTRTAWVAGATAVAAICNVALNALLVPKFGAAAAAWSTAAAYGVLVLSHAVVAGKLFPVRWHYERWALMASAGAAVVVVRYTCAS